MQDALHFRHRIECPVKTVGSELYVRVSVACYNGLSDYRALGNAVLEEAASARGSPGVSCAVLSM
eukprot:COSAG05_NODE_1439_length_4884_cov_11.725065_3_plen_65_part_00